MSKRERVYACMPCAYEHRRRRKANHFAILKLGADGLEIMNFCDEHAAAFRRIVRRNLVERYPPRFRYQDPEAGEVVKVGLLQ